MGIGLWCMHTCLHCFFLPKITNIVCTLRFWYLHMMAICKCFRMYIWNPLKIRNLLQWSKISRSRLLSYGQNLTCRAACKNLTAWYSLCSMDNNLFLSVLCQLPVLQVRSKFLIKFHLCPDGSSVLYSFEVSSQSGSLKLGDTIFHNFSVLHLLALSS